MCSIPVIRNLVAHSLGQEKSASVFEFSHNLAFKNQKNVAPITPVIRHITSAIVYLTHANIAELYSAPEGETDFSGMFRLRYALPIHNLEA